MKRTQTSGATMTSIRPRMKNLALLVSATLTQLAIMDVALADSAVGVDTTIGNAMNPAPYNPTLAGGSEDQDGMGTHAPGDADHSPTGQLYDIPVVPYEGLGTVEIGFGGVNGDKDRQLFRQYKDLDKGVYLHSFGISSQTPETANYVEVTGGGVGRDDQFYSLTTGKYNDWRVKMFYNETPHVFTTTYRSLWDGVGSENLTLTPTATGAGLVAGGGGVAAATVQTNVRSALTNTENSELGLIRKKGGIRYDMALNEKWNFFATYTDEERKGSRPFGAVWGGGGGGGNAEIPESIDYSTRDLMAGIQFGDKLTNFNLQVSASQFRNAIDTMTFDNPLTIGLNGTTGLTTGVFTQGRYDLVPSNDSFKVKADYARRLPEFLNSRITAGLTLTRYDQNDSLVAPTPYALTGGTVTGSTASLANNWNTTNALSKQTSEAKIDTTLATLGLSMNPTDTLNVKGNLRHYKTKNSTEYWACNPLTGQWGRVLNEGSGMALMLGSATVGNNPAYATQALASDAINAAGCNLAAVKALGIVPSAGNTNIRNIPYAYEQDNYVLSADYRLNRTSNVNATVEREEFKREHRERDDTWENKLKIGYTNRGLPAMTMRITGEIDSRRGSEYNPDPYEEFNSASMGPLPTATGTNVASWIHNIEQFRKFDLADRDQNVLNARFNVNMKSDLDLGLTLQRKDADYPGSEYGRMDQQKLNSANLDLNYQPTAGFGLTGFLSYQKGNMSQTSIQPNGCVIGNYYYFYSDGSIQTNATGVPPAPPTGASLVNTTQVTSTNWEGVCSTASSTSPLYPTSRAWDLSSEDRNKAAGIGMRYMIGTVRLDLNYGYVSGVTSIRYSYNAAGLAITPTQAAIIGDGWSDLEYKQHSIDLSVLVPVTKAVSTRFIGRYEKGTIRDWHYDGVSNNPMPANNAVYLDSGPEDYKAYFLGALMRVQF